MSDLGARQELTAFLETLGLGRYAQVMAENDVDLDVLPHLSDQDLKELGLSLGHRRKLLAALAQQVESGTDSATSPRAEPAVAERRQLTVMFCDLVGSTQLSEQLDLEVLRDLLRRYHDAVTGAVVAHGGHVAKLMGDGVLAYFGWPKAHENDAERAVQAGLAAVAAVHAIEADSAHLAARAGIATGPVVIGDMTGETAQERGSVTGTTPNLAARLQDLAAPGEVVIHAVTRRLIGAAFALDDLGAHQLKGIAEPVPVWRVIGAAASDSRFEALHGARLTAFVGRTQEIELLVDRWCQAQGGEGQVVLLSGEAGIGKSRILREFVRRPECEAGKILRYQCSPNEINTAFHPLIAELEATAGFQAEDPVEARLNKLEAHLEGLSDAAEIPLIVALLGLPLERYPTIEMTPQRRKQRTIALLAERVAGLARGAPLVLVVEDIHWADASSLEALEALIEAASKLPLLLVMTYRPEFQPQWRRFGHVTEQSLNRLGQGDGRAIAQRVAGGKALPEELLARILAQTDGIPLFVEELTKTVLESGVLREQAERYLLDGPLPALAIPTTLQDSLMARLDRLAPVKGVIQAAACIGREFGAELLATALQMAQDELDEALDQLVTAELIFHRGGGEESRYIFKHALVQDAAYASLLTPARRSLHERLATAMARGADPDPLDLARHFHAAGREGRAAELFLAGGRRSLETCALSEAIGALELGLDAVGAIEASPERDRLELRIRVALGTARMARFGWAHPSVAEAFEPAFPLARAFGEEDALGSILWGLWVHYQTRTNFPRAHEWLAELANVAKAAERSNLSLIYDMSAGCQYFWEADYGRALSHTDQVRSRYESDQHARITLLTNHDPLVFSQHWAGSLADWIAGRPDRALERLEEALALARKIGHPFNLVFALTAGATSLIYLDETERLLALCDEAAGVAADEALGPFSEHVNIMQWRGAAHVQLGDYERGHGLAKQGNDFWTASGGRICTAMFRSWILLGLQGLGRVEEAAELAAANTAHCRATGDRYMEPECLRLQGELALLAPRPDRSAAERLFREALSVARAHGAKSWELRAAMSLARLLRDEDRRAVATQELEPVLTSFTEGLESADPRRAAQLLADLS
ncbi:MAG: AAA family ATPase [Pseudomonadota bacterium]